MVPQMGAAMHRYFRPISFGSSKTDSNNTDPSGKDREILFPRIISTSDE